MNFTSTKDVLNQMVADLSQMSMVIHQTHWYMRGFGFLYLHPLMDDYKSEIDDQLDIVAERLVALNGSPVSTLQEISEKTKISSEPGTYDKSMSELLNNLLTDYKYLDNLYTDGIKISGDENDFASQDIMITFKELLEKRIWMISAQLKNNCHHHHCSK